MTTKGSAVVFVRGKYFGKSGWIDGEKPATAKMYYVIVNLGHAEKKTRVKKESVRILEDTARPASYAEAALSQNRDIESKLDSLCNDLAKCSIYEDTAGMIAIIKHKLHAAAERQAALGNKATFRHVDWGGDDDEGDI
jgi:hypothetical protein